MRAALPVATAAILVLGLAGCAPGDTESDLTKDDVVRKLTANPPPDGTKRLTKAACDEDGKNKYVCQVTTEDDDDLELTVRADGDDIRVIGVKNR